MIVILIACSTAITAVSAYGLGQNEFDKNGSLYQGSKSFLSIGTGLTIFLIITLIISIMLYVDSNDFEIPQN